MTDSFIYKKKIDVKYAILIIVSGLAKDFGSRFAIRKSGYQIVKSRCHLDINWDSRRGSGFVKVIYGTF